MSNIRSGPRHFFRINLIRILLKNSLKNGTILDAGSGDGSLSIRLAKDGFFIRAVDNSEEWCGIFEQRLKDAPFKDKITIHCRGVEEIKFKPGYFDAVICGELLEHVNDDVKTLSDYYSFLKKKGILIISVPLANKEWDVSDSQGGHLRLYELTNLTDILEKAGFKIISIFGWGYPFAKIYNKLVFARWARKVKKTEAEIMKPRHLMTHIGKNQIVSFILSIFFFIDIIFTPGKKAIGVIIKARKE